MRLDIVGGAVLVAAAAACAPGGARQGYVDIAVPVLPSISCPSCGGSGAALGRVVVVHSEGGEERLKGTNLPLFVCTRCEILFTRIPAAQPEGDRNEKDQVG